MAASQPKQSSRTNTLSRSVSSCCYEPARTSFSKDERSLGLGHQNPLIFLVAPNLMAAEIRRGKQAQPRPCTVLRRQCLSQTRPTGGDFDGFRQNRTQRRCASYIWTRRKWSRLPKIRGPSAGEKEVVACD